jgi:hypothetical protein
LSSSISPYGYILEIVQCTTMHKESQMEIDRYWQKVKFLPFSKSLKCVVFEHMLSMFEISAKKYDEKYYVE